MNGPDLDDADDSVQQRHVSAADVPPPQTRGASSVFNWRGAGTAAATASDPEPPQETTPTTSQPEQETMATTKKRNGAARARKSTRGSPQLVICQALLEEDLSREAIAEKCSDLTASQISSALQNAKKLGRIAWIEKSQTFRLTATGKEWLAAAAGEAPPEEAPETPKRGAGKRGAHRRPRRAKSEEVDTSPPAGGGESTYRCAVMSDGCFFLTKDGVTIELEPDEHAGMLRYLERMAEAA